MKSFKLLALSCVAFHAGKYDEAGRLFAESMNSPDVDEALTQMFDHAGLSYAEQDLENLISESSATFKSLSEIAEEIAASMENQDCVPVTTDQDSDIDQDDVDTTDYTELEIVEASVEPTVESVIEEKPENNSIDANVDSPIDPKEPETPEITEDTPVVQQTQEQSVSSVLRFKQC